MGREITDLMVGFGTWFLTWHMAKDLPEASATPFTRSYWIWIGVRVWRMVLLELFLLALFACIIAGDYIVRMVWR